LSIFNLEASQTRAKERLGAALRPTGRRTRADRGHVRIDERVLGWLVEETSGYDRPPIARVLARLTDRCHREGLRPPSRATVYKLLGVLPTPRYRLADLPASAQAALYNLGPDSEVPAHQVVFYCFNYGDLQAMSFAAGLPWLALYQALRMPGHRAKSRGVLDAVAHARGI